METTEWLTVSQFADELGVHPKTAYAWFSQGHGSGRCPRFMNAGRTIRIRRDWLDAWVEERSDAAA